MSVSDQPGVDGPASKEAPTDPDAAAPGSAKQTASPLTLSRDDQRLVAELQTRDRDVRAHEAAHQAAGGGVVGGATFSYQQGPDGRQYAVGGEVPVDLSVSGGSPEATIAKMARVRAAAMAPGDPSAQDFAVAAAASAIEAAVRQEERGKVTEAKNPDSAAEPSAASDAAAGAGQPSVPAQQKAATAAGTRDDDVATSQVEGSASAERSFQRALGAYRVAASGALQPGIDQRA